MPTTPALQPEGGQSRSQSTGSIPGYLRRQKYIIAILGTLRGYHPESFHSPIGASQSQNLITQTPWKSNFVSHSFVSIVRAAVQAVQPFHHALPTAGGLPVVIVVIHVVLDVIMLVVIILLSLGCNQQRRATFIAGLPCQRPPESLSLLEDIVVAFQDVLCLYA